MKKLTLFTALLCIWFSSCVPIIKIQYGICQPKQETCESIFNFLVNNHYPLSGQYIFKDSTSCFEMYRKHKKVLLTTIIVNKNYQVITIDTTHCQWSGGYFVRRLKKDTTYAIDSSLDVRWLLSNIISTPDSTGISSKDDFDFLVINTWGKFIGKMNERLFATISSVKERKDIRIKVINLNCDVQKSWNVSKDNMIVFN